MSEAFLLSPYRPPTSYPVQLDADEAVAWLAGYFALWHPAVVARLGRPPRLASAYDHDQPKPGAVYAVPAGPEIYLPDDWAYRLAEGGGRHVAASADQGETTATVRAMVGGWPHADAADETVLRFQAIGYGYLIVDGLFEAADHDRLLDEAAFWADLQAALGRPDEELAHLTGAAEKLLAARDGLNPNRFALMDWLTLDGRPADAGWPLTLDAGLPATVVTSLEALEALDPVRLAELRDRAGRVEVATGSLSGRDDTLLPAEAQWHALTRSADGVRQLLGVDVTTFARPESSAHLFTPALLQAAGYRYALLTPRDDAVWPGGGAAVLNWPSPDGKTIDAIGRAPQDAADPLTFFNLTHTLHEALSRDSSPLVILRQSGEPAVGYRQLVTLSTLAPVVGEFTTPQGYLASQPYGEYLGGTTADEFRLETLSERVRAGTPNPVSAFATFRRQHLQLESAFALQALLRTLEAPTEDDDKLTDELAACERDLVWHAPDSPVDSGRLAALEQTAAARLADRLSAKGTPGRPGTLVLNAAGVARRVGLEFPNATGTVPLGGAVKASEGGRVVAELPPLGFAWVPEPQAAPTPKSRGKLADGHAVRNEFLEAELDPATGGLRALRDTRTGQNRLGMQLVHAAGGVGHARKLSVTQSGGTCGDVTAEGDILADDGRVLAAFRTQLRLWAGRPAAELAIEVYPTHPLEGDAWADHFAARFGWRDERTALWRGLLGRAVRTQSRRFDAPEYLEFRLGSERTVLFTGGLGFWQAAGPRAADCVLITAHETESRFEFLLALDRDYPTPTARSWFHPPPRVAVPTGPPGGLVSSPLITLDLPSLSASHLRATPGRRSVTLDLTETAGFGGAADLAFGHPPQTARIVTHANVELQTLPPTGQVVGVEFSAQETLRLEVAWPDGRPG